MNVLVFAVLMLAFHEPEQSSVLITEEERRQFDEIGTCIRGTQSFDLRQAMFLENRFVDIDGQNGLIRVSINRSDLIVEEVESSSEHRRFINNIANIVDPASEVDIELKLTYFNGRLMLYWKEAFQNRHYRQGLFNILGTEVLPLCSGIGGRYTVR